MIEEEVKVDLEEEEEEPAAPENKVQPKEKAASVFSAAVNLINSSIGAGCLGLPLAVRKLGLILGIVLTIVFAFLSAYGLSLLQKVADKLVSEVSNELLLQQTSPNGNNAVDLQPISSTKDKENENPTSVPLSTGLKRGEHVSFGWISSRISPFSGRIIDFANIVVCFSAMICYLMVLGDLLPEITAFIADYFVIPSTDSTISGSTSSLISLSSYYYSQNYILNLFLKRWVWILISTACLAPLCYMRKLDNLRFISLGAVISVLYLLFLMLYFLLFNPQVNPTSTISLWPTSLLGLYTIPIFAFAYTCHMNFYEVYDELGNEGNKQKRVLKSILGCTGTTFILYTAFSVVGDLVCKELDANIVNCLPVDMVSVLIARIFVVSLVAFSYPIMFHPSRSSLDTLIFGTKVGIIGHKKIRWFLETTFLLIISLVIALVFSQLGLILSLSGSIGSSLACYVIPGYYYYKVFAKHNEQTNHKIASYCSIALIIFGIVFTICGVAFALIQAF